MYEQSMSHISLKNMLRCYDKSSNVQDMLWPIPGLISCAGGDWDCCLMHVHKMYVLCKPFTFFQLWFLGYSNIIFTRLSFSCTWMEKLVSTGKTSRENTHTRPWMTGKRFLKNFPQLSQITCRNFIHKVLMLHLQCILCHACNTSNRQTCICFHSKNFVKLHSYSV